MNLQHLLDLVVRPALKHLDMHSEAAEQLVMGTITQESHGEYIRQLGGGPALGLVQMEPFTHDDCWSNWIHYRGDVHDDLCDLLSGAAYGHLEQYGHPPADELVGNLPYAVAMCRIKYRRVSEPLPVAGDVAAMARYWKRHYNTEGGKGTPDEFIENFPAELWPGI